MEINIWVLQNTNSVLNTDTLEIFEEPGARTHRLICM